MIASRTLSALRRTLLARALLLLAALAAPAAADLVVTRNVRADAFVRPGPRGPRAPARRASSGRCRARG